VNDYSLVNRKAFAGFEASVNLFMADADGEPLRDQAVWQGGVVEQFRLRSDFDTRLVPDTGARSLEAIQVGEAHVLEFQRTWLARAEDDVEFDPELGARYVLELIFQDAKTLLWRRFLYAGAVLTGHEHVSERLFRLALNASFRATSRAVDGGRGTAPGGTGGGVTTVAGFYHFGACVTSPATELPFLGHVGFSYAATLQSARLTAISGREDTEIELLLNGVAQATVFTIEGTVADEDVSLSLPDLGLELAAGTEVRWRTKSGTATAEDAPVQVAITCRFTAGNETPLEFIHDGALPADASDESWLGAAGVLPRGSVITRAKLKARPGTTTTILTLYLGGVATATTLTLAGAVSDDEVAVDSGPLAIAVAANVTVQWQATSGPTVPEDCAWQLALTVTAKT
jgi:hypothetical protein